MNSIDLYPQSPQNIDKSITSPGKEYIRQVTKVFCSVVLFMLIYMALLAIAGGMLYYGIQGAFYIITAKFSFITLAAGAGMVGLAVMFAWFMVKFIFKTRKNENPQRIQIFENEHPQLFAFIRKLATETGTPFPKKIFISPEVNACVFYNSSFLSLFLPVPKNLEIGLGLVNSVNMSEFKAVIAHEFGHFSQKSMKLGSYIYTVNHMLYNLVYEYDSWDHTLEKWANIGGIFGFFAIVTFKMISVVRFILGKAYNFINLFYMSLSRAMEYHADLVAVSVAGSIPMKHALRRIELSAVAYDYSMNYLQTQAEKGRYSSNIYLNHQAAISHLCHTHELSKSGHLPVIEDTDVPNNASKSRLRIKDQWASHPSMEERELNILKHPATVVIHAGSPWKLFENPAQVQEAMTRHLYQLLLPDTKDLQLENAEIVQQHINQEIEAGKLDSRYNGYYNGRTIEYFDVPQTIADIFNSQGYFTKEADLFSDAVVQKIEQLHTNTHDRQTLQQIISGQVDAKFFEFDAIKYRRKEAGQLRTRLDTEIAEQQKWLCNQDKQVFGYYYRLAMAQGNTHSIPYAASFTDYFALQAEEKKFAGLLHRMQVVQYQLITKPRWTDDEQRNLVGEISSLHMLFEKYLREAEAINLSVPINDQAGENQTFRACILTEPVAAVSSVTFDYEQLQVFGNQVSQVINRIATVTNECFKRILAMQISLSQGDKISTDNQIAC
ncbi:M48 family metallopeptidase [Rhodocytophaga aerolata]|uniref:M48 family metallopeptidase n=1 Tax=Rhodocytophaga aerolata TaxID=455078 RepID=A0ABT8RBI5_9BACT|nr:M48 family metallopeptidase [Rhodocytophaga aerolata]MDO1449051.1 M48 family metallopeptidase [Rhodocytophaga aerolata]